MGVFKKRKAPLRNELFNAVSQTAEQVLNALNAKRTKQRVKAGPLSCCPGEIQSYAHRMCVGLGHRVYMPVVALPGRSHSYH